MRDFLTEESFEKRMNEELLPLLESVAHEGHFRSTDGKKLHFVRYAALAPRGTVVILHGYTESAAKYRELCAYFVRDGLDVLILDQRGHGDSVREGKDGAVYVKRFEQYTEDLDALLHTVAGDIHKPYYLFGHSMGGGVAALYLEQHPDVFAKAILDAPMIEMTHKGISRAGCRFLCGFAKLIGKGKHPIELLRKPREGGERAASYRSAARAAYYRAFREAHPHYRVGPASFAWLYTAIDLPRRVLAKGAPERVRIPVRLYAAEYDHLVEREPQIEFISRVQNGELVTVKGAEHEIYSAVDAVSHPFFEGVLDFFAE